MQSAHDLFIVVIVRVAHTHTHTLTQAGSSWHTCCLLLAAWGMRHEACRLARSDSDSLLFLPLPNLFICVYFCCYCCCCCICLLCVVAACCFRPGLQLHSIHSVHSVHLLARWEISFSTRHDKPHLPGAYARRCDDDGDCGQRASILVSNEHFQIANVQMSISVCVCVREREYTCVCINWCMFDVTLLALPASLSLSLSLALSPFSAWVDGDCAARVCRIVLHSSLRATFAQAIHTLTLSHSHRHSSTHMHTLTHSGNSAREKLLFVLCKWLRRRQRPAEQFRRRRRHLCRTLPLLVWYFPSRFIFGTQLKPKVWKARMSEQLSLLLLWFLVAVGIRLRLALHWVKVSKRIRFAFANAIASARGREREWQIEIK